MKIIKNFDDYLLDIIVESIDISNLVFSDRFLSLINIIEHPISNHIKINENEPGYKITYIDLDDSGNDKVSFITSIKAREIILGKKQSDEYIDRSTYRKIKYDEDIYDKLMNTNRSVTTIGRLINKLFPDKFKSGGSPGEDIESFVKIFKSLRQPKKMKLVSGGDIVKYYNVNEYLYGENKGNLGNSCMRYEECENYISFYEINSDVVSLLVMFDKDEDDEEKVIGRSLVWKLSSPEGRYFMDRVYTAFDYDVEQFIQYAKEQEWLYKKNQTSSTYEHIVDPRNDTEKYNMTLLVSNVSENDEYPYMDTLKYFCVDKGKLTNDEDYFKSHNFYILEDTEGGYEENESGEWSDYYGEFIDPNDYDIIWCELGYDYRYRDDAIYLDFYDDWATDTYVDNNMIECDYYDGSSPYRERNDTVDVYGSNEIACSEYAESNLVYSEFLDEYLPDGKDVWSEYHDSNLYINESVEVYTDISKKNTDYRSDDENDGNWWKWDYDDEKYDNSITEEELKEYHGLEDDE